METDIGSPIDYKPTIEPPPPPPPPPDANATSTPIEETAVQEPTQEEWDQYMRQQAMLAQQQGYYEPPEKKDLWSSVDKTMIIAMFVALIVGFFLGSSRQPVFLKYN
jgi:hypothetical protein|tara:strand:- start:364 stop:684 length:321 start_codon:yes stop_codon:yes gene_type:complete